jgi:hypothetical protein
MNHDEQPRREFDLKDDPKVISPLVLDEPLYQCAAAVTVISFIPHAQLEIEIGGGVVATVTGGFPEPNGQSVSVPALVAGQKVRARQKTPTATSAWSPTVAVKDHTKDYPAGPPRPEINPAPVYRCGSRTGVSNLLVGSNVWITADAVQVGGVGGAKAHQGVNVNPDYNLGQHVRAWSELCKDPSPPSEEHIMRGLVRTAEARLAPIGESGLNPLDASSFGERLGARFAHITGVTPRLPTVLR